MQKIIAKYGAAVHLSLLAAAPLFLFPFLSDRAISVVLLWFSGLAALWCLAEPSLRREERLHQARARVRKALVVDPLFWGLALVVLVTTVRAFNTGVEMAYDAENAKWQVSLAKWAFLPGCVGQTGLLSAATALASLVLIQGCRHALGRSARLVFLLLSSTFSGVAAVVAVVSLRFGNRVLQEAFACSPTMSFFVGTIFSLYLLGGTVAFGVAIERRWPLAVMLSPLALTGNMAGFVAFSPPFQFVVFSGAELLLVALVFFSMIKVLPDFADIYKGLIAFGVTVAIGVVGTVMILSADSVFSRCAPLAECQLFPEGFKQIRGILSEVAQQAWFSHLWIGTGLGSFPLDFRFMAGDDALQLIRDGHCAVPNGWLHLLAERGIVGALLILLPTGILLFTFVRHFVDALPLQGMPRPAVCLFPLVLVTLAIVGTFSCTVLRPDVLMVAGAFLTLSSNSFDRRGGGKNG